MFLRWLWVVVEIFEVVLGGFRSFHDLVLAMSKFKVHCINMCTPKASQNFRNNYNLQSYYCTHLNHL